MFRWLKCSSFTRTFSNVKKRNSIGRLISLNTSNTEKQLNQTQIQTQTQKNNSISGATSKRTQLYPILAACTAESYDFTKLLPYLQKNFKLSPFICDEVLHIRLDDDTDKLKSAVTAGEVFFFKNGALVYWSGDPESNFEGIGSILKDNLLPTIKPFEVSSFIEPEFEELSYKMVSGSGNGNVTGIVDETVILNEETVSIKDKLAFSNGLADSVKLGVLERMMDEHIEKVKNIPSALMNKGKIYLGRREMLSLTGELLHFRAQLNLNSDLMDTPDIYWSEPKLEELYTRISRVLETKRRSAVLNKKLDYAKEMAQVLSEHLAEQHGLKLEWGIIALIAVEVAFETFHLIGKLIQ